MAIEPAPYRTSLSLYVQKLISKGSPRAYKFRETPRLIDTVNDDGEFSSSYKYVYSKQLEVKIERQVKHATFLGFKITFEDHISGYKLFGKRDTFPLFIVCMPYLSSNIRLSISFA